MDNTFIPKINNVNGNQANPSNQVNGSTQVNKINQLNNSSTPDNNQINVPGAKSALNNMKQEVANELGINLKQGYNGDITSRDAGSVGGYMVKKMIEQQERAMSGATQSPQGINKPY